MAAPRVQECDGALGAPARGAVDQLEAIDLEADERLGEVRDLEADVVEALALVREEAGDAGRVVGGLDELDLRLADREERDPDPVRAMSMTARARGRAGRDRAERRLDRARR